MRNVSWTCGLKCPIGHQGEGDSVASSNPGCGALLTSANFHGLLSFLAALGLALEFAHEGSVHYTAAVEQLDCISMMLLAHLEVHSANG